MQKEYDKKIAQHYSLVAKEQGLSSTSTMADEVTRDLETRAIIRFVGECLKARRAQGLNERAVIMDVGCGNGYTLSVLAKQYPGQRFVGVEKSDELRALASSRFKKTKNVEILKGDIREKHIAKNVVADILICQRVLINLLDLKDQKSALNNIVNAVAAPQARKPGGRLLFLEGFMSSLERLNEARGEFDLPRIPQAHHNLYLPDDFFEVPRLKPVGTDGPTPPNFLSTHYYVTRVLHPVFTQNKAFKRNSEFVRFFTAALNQNAGDYSSLKLHMFEKV